MLYHLYDLQHAFMTPARLSAEATGMFYRHPWNPLSYTQAGRTISAGAELFERSTRRFTRPAFDLPETRIDGRKVKITEDIVLEKPFCNLLHFKRSVKRTDPKVLVVAPMSGHFSTLLRGTVEALLPHHDVYITDWVDSRQVPLKDGKFDLDTYIAYLMEFFQFLKPPVHTIAVCQPAVPVFAAAALMEEMGDKNAPASMTLMGGPIDPRISKTQVTELAEQRPLSWFENTVVSRVPFYYPGAHRHVYPGFLQLGGFMSMNLDRHVGSHLKFYHHLVTGDGESAEGHRKFYDEYLSVMDISAEFYLQTVKTVFQKHDLPRGKMIWTDPATGKQHKVDPKQIKKTALLTIEGERDDISAHGQTTAAHDLCKNLPANRQYHHFQKEVGHYGIFNGRRWRGQIMPRIRHFIRQFETRKISAIPEKDLALIPDQKAPQWNKALHGIDAIRARQRKEAEREGRMADIIDSHE